MKKRTSLIMMATLLVFLGACGKKTTEAAKGDTLVVGLDDTFVPMGFRDDDGKLTGFDVELAQAVFDLEDKKVEFQPIEWSMKETELKNGTIDMIWNGYSKTEEREKAVLFTEPYMENVQLVVTKKDSGIDTIDKMAGKVLGAQEGSSGYDAFNDQSETLKDIVKDNEPVLYASFNEAFLDLETGRIDGLLIDRVYADYYLSQKDQTDDFNLMDSTFTAENFAVGVRKEETDLAEEINEAIQKLREDGKFQEISDKWFGQDVYPN